jgi:hypothetical protein
MANTSVYTGADGSITLSPASGLEGDAAGGIIEGFDTMSVGRVQDVRVEILSSIRAYHEIGHRFATELRPGNVTIRGTIGRAMINGAMLRLLLGEAADGRPRQSWPQPSFNITLMVENPTQPGVRNVLTLHEVKLESWTYAIPEDDFVAETVAFQAVSATVADEA